MLRTPNHSSTAVSTRLLLSMFRFDAITILAYNLSPPSLINDLCNTLFNSQDELSGHVKTNH
jgi:hypothetical protein